MFKCRPNLQLFQHGDDSNRSGEGEMTADPDLVAEEVCESELVGPETSALCIHTERCMQALKGCSRAKA